MADLTREWIAALRPSDHIPSHHPAETRTDTMRALCDLALRGLEDEERLDFLIDYCAAFTDKNGVSLPENSREAIDAARRT